MPEYLVGYKSNGGFPNKDYLRIEVIDAGSPEDASNLCRNPLWVTEFKRDIPAGMAPRKIKQSLPVVTDEAVDV